MTEERERRAAPTPTGDRDQHFLVDDRVLDRIVDRAPEADHVLEIGGGAGALTERLVDAYDRVTVVELDDDLADHLAASFPEADVVEGDATEVALPGFDAAVANLPYSITSPMLFRLLPRRRPTVLTIQAEVADRMAADVGDDDYGRLSVTAGYYADIEVVERVPPTAFDPPPEVTSAVVATTPRREPPDVGDEAFFLDLLRAVFTQRRKTLRNAVANTAHISGIDDVEGAVDALPEDLASRRPGGIGPEAFARLARELHGR
jgi:16S rRNA (adenine1518-N6/adenine1519-N6)-dimethyltransferase